MRRTRVLIHDTSGEEVPVRDYTVHAFFHALAIVVGFAIGTAGGLWWSDREAAAGWMLVSALAMGVLILALQAVYIVGTSPARRTRPRTIERARVRRADGTRPELRPVAAPATAVQPAATVSAEQHRDGTRTSATEALRAYQARQRMGQ